MKILIFLFGIQAFIASTPTPPVWGGNPQFQVYINVTVPNNTFQLFYQYDSVANVSKYNNIAPQYDESCSTFCGAPSAYLTHNCSLTFAKDTWFYINYPSDNWCCKCAQVGIIEPDWLKTNSTFKGQLTINERTCNWWSKQGFELNNYCAEVGTDLPVRYWESAKGTGPTILQWDFQLATYKVMQFDTTIFNAPQNCQTLCGGACAEFRNMTQTTKE